MLTDINPALSKKVVDMLLADGLTLTAIAREAGTTPAFLRKVQEGKAALKPEHLDKLDDIHPELPFRIGGALVKGEAMDLAKKAGRAAKHVGKKGGEVMENIGRGLRKGAWKLLNGVLGGEHPTD